MSDQTLPLAQLIERSSATDAQRYSDVLLHCVLSRLPTTGYGSVAVDDAWTEGEWSIAITFRQAARASQIGLHARVLALASGDRVRFSGNGRLCAYPPEPAPAARRIADWITEPLGAEAKDLEADGAGTLWAGRTPAPPDPERGLFGINLTRDEAHDVRNRIAQLDVQLHALAMLPRSRDIRQGAHAQRHEQMARLLHMSAEEVAPVFALLPDRMRDEDRARLQTERHWLSSWLAV